MDLTDEQRDYLLDLLRKRRESLSNRAGINFFGETKQRYESEVALVNDTITALEEGSHG